MDEKKDPRNIKIDKHAKANIINRIIDLIGDNFTYAQIRDIVSSESGKSPQSANRYYNLALDELKKQNANKTENVRNMRILGMQRDLQEAYSNYLIDKSPRWFDIYLSIKAKLDEYYPDSLKPKSESPDLNIQISYGLATKSDVEDQNGDD